jgi:hypothetical protein
MMADVRWKMDDVRGKMEDGRGMMEDGRGKMEEGRVFRLSYEVFVFRILFSFFIVSLRNKLK